MPETPDPTSTPDPADPARPVAAALAAWFLDHQKQGPVPARGDYYTAQAETLLGGYYLAAACSGRDLAEVRGWLADPVSPEPCALLVEHGRVDVARALRVFSLMGTRQRDVVFALATGQVPAPSGPGGTA